MRILKKGLIVLAVVVVLVIVVGVLTMNTLVRKGIEAGTTSALGTKTTVDSVSVHLFSGSVTLNGLDISNPEGFQAKEFLTLEKGTVSASLGSLMSNTVVVNEVIIERPVVTIEAKGLGTNLNVIMDNLGKNAKTQQEKSEGKGYRIKRIAIKGATAKFLLVGKEPIQIDLPDIEMTDLGTGQPNGVKIGIVTLEVITRLAQEIAVKGAGKVPADVLNNLNSAVNGAMRAVTGITKGLEKGAGDILKSLPTPPGLGGN